MLVLSRRLNERIFIGKNNEIKITVVKQREGRVRLGIEAPKDIPIFREEILERILDKEQEQT
jgi:carbon storage regulator